MPVSGRSAETGRTRTHAENTRAARVDRSPAQARRRLTQCPLIAGNVAGLHRNVRLAGERVVAVPACAVARCRTHHAHSVEHPLKPPLSVEMVEPVRLPDLAGSCFVATLTAARWITTEARRDRGSPPIDVLASLS
jgi:hypothetical protein